MVGLQEKSSTRSAAKTPRQRLGQRGEEIALTYLRFKGYQLEAINWRASRFGEIDLVMLDINNQTRVFVEVKTRKGNYYGTPADAVTIDKQARLYQLGELYLTRLSTLSDAAHPDWNVRFDVISVYFPGQNKPADIQHLPNAF